MPDFPYPTCVEIIRGCSKVLGVKGADKELDDRALDKNVDPRKVRDFKSTLIKKLSFCMTPQVLEVFKSQFYEFFSKYIGLIGTTAVDGLTRNDINRLLASTLGRDAVMGFVKMLLAQQSGRFPSLILFFSSPGNTTPLLINWLSETNEVWHHFVSKLTKERVAKIKAWQNGEHTPDTSSLSLIGSWASPTFVGEKELRNIQQLLFLSAAMDRLSNEPSGMLIIDECRLMLLGGRATFSLNEKIANLQKRYLSDKQELLPLIASLQYKLMRTVKKREEENEELGLTLSRLANHSQKDYHMDYWTYWLRARYCVYNGKIDEANSLYKKAFEQGLYRAGNQQKFIIEEAIVVSSSIANPDKVFLKHLKFATLAFGYDIPSVQVKTASNKVSDVIESWELDNWRSSFHKVFPESGLFESGKKKLVEKTIGPVYFSRDEFEKYQPDYRYPNRKIKIVNGNTKKTWPQLVLFVFLNKKDIVKRLLEQGASVDSVSSSNESALLIALGKLDVTEVPFPSLDESCFRLLAKYPHDNKTVNTCTSKRKLLPLIEAVKSGKPDIVKILIELGADINQRGETDLQTPLNVCIKIIGMLKDSEKSIYQQINMPITPEALDSVRRCNPGVTGFTLEHQWEIVSKNHFAPLAQKLYGALIRARSRFTNAHASLSHLRSIAVMLIEAGADVNAIHASPLRGYTPLMLAVELDEFELVKKMLIHEGDLRKSYYNKQLSQRLNCRMIAELYHSQGVLRVFEDIKHYYPKQ